METLSTTEPHYIRCVKPNTVLKPGIFENFNVLNQLRCGGVLEAIRISCAGYPTKRAFDEFIDRFGMLAPDLIDSSDEKQVCAAICDRMGLKRHNGDFAELNKSYSKLKKSSLILQCLWRGRLGRKELRKLRMAARETGALKEAKDKLEKKVEELTWRLDFEKHLRIDLEEAKGQEIAKLQSSLQEMQEKLDAANTTIIREKEAARIAIENAPPVIKEVPVLDDTKLELLTNKNMKLESEELERRYQEVQMQTETLIKEAERSQTKISQLQEMIESLETTLSSLESENQVLRQQALVTSENEELTQQIKRPNIASQTLVQEPVHPPVQTVENGYQVLKEEPKIEQVPSLFPPAPVLSKQKSLTNRQQENHDALIKCLMEDKENALKLSSTSKLGSIYYFGESVAHLVMANSKSWSPRIGSLVLQSNRRGNPTKSKSNYFAGNSLDELMHIRQAAGFLKFMYKNLAQSIVFASEVPKVLEEITDELCPALSLPQIYRIGTMFCDDKYGTQGLSQDIIGKMRAIMTDDSTNIPNSSFLLDDDSRQGDQPYGGGILKAGKGEQSYFGQKPLKDRVAIVTGGSGGIGSEISTHLAALGAKVVVGYVGDSSLAEAVLSAINSASAGLPSPRPLQWRPTFR
ncbi:hypothetical protein HPP92_023552 [Vanilla planifolia]|uniref:Myosin motor domain-containing protein n=1 Tax=Vanilla planifolia TaxID=51239 RepID=A0A835UEQ9_VANPL|nr:hypothetical protein HPP92_023552 [Vanilla planifolia]